MGYDIPFVQPLIEINPYSLAHPPAYPKTYACGFLFSLDRQYVALINKERPDYQAGKINGIGGKVDVGETPHRAMVREFQEEAGVLIPEWQRLAKIERLDGTVHFFSAFSDDIDLIQTMTDELVNLHLVKEAVHYPNLMPYLRFLIPLALDDGDIEKPIYLFDRTPT
jgi:8-oxo-dGTP diphosphatase